MDVCKYCGDYLPAHGMTIVLCSCPESVQNEIMLKARTASWAKARTAAIDSARKERRLARRLANKKI